MPRRSAIAVASTIALFALGVQTCSSAKTHHSPSSNGRHNADYDFIKAAYDYRNYGYVTRDCNRIYTYTTPDFVLVDSAGRHNKAACIRSTYSTLMTLYQIRGELEKQTTFSETVTRTVDIKSIAVSQGRAVIVEVGTVHVSATAGEGASEATSNGDRVDGVFRDTWVRTSQGWLEQSSHKIQ